MIPRVSVTDPTNNTTNELSDDELRKLFLWCREHTAEPDALTTLNDMGPILLRPSVGKEMVETVNAIIDTLAIEKEPSAHIHAHMMILLSTLIDHRTQRDAFDAILLRWIRHPASFGPARATPPELQRDAFLQRLADSLGWNAISVTADHDAIARFLSWVDTWAPKQKSAAGRIIAMMRRNFPEGGELWRLVRYEQTTHHYGNQNKRPQQNNQGNQNRRPQQQQQHNKPRNPPAAAPDAAGAAAAPGVDGEQAAADGSTPGSTGTPGVPGAPGEGKRRRNRRRNRNRENNPNAANAGGTDGGEGSDAGGSDGGSDSSSDSSSDSGSTGDSSAPSTAPATVAAPTSAPESSS